MIAPAEIQTRDLATSTELGESNITSRLVGSAETPMKAALGAYFQELHAAAAASKVAEVIVDLRALKFMNSTCFKTLVVWISMLSQAAPHDRYRIRFMSDESKYWQSRSLAALATFADDLIHVQAS